MDPLNEESDPDSHVFWTNFILGEENEERAEEGVALNEGEESEEKVLVLFSGKGQDGAGLPLCSAVTVGAKSVWRAACAGIS